MKILAVITSPRRGNSYGIIRKIERAVREKEAGVEFSYLFLSETKLEHCRGCFACIGSGEELCPINDDLGKVMEAMQAADGVIFVSPVYVMQVSTLLKNLFDRLAYLNHRPAFFGKYAMAVVTSCGAGMPETLKYMETVIRTWGFQVVHKLGVMQHPAVAVTTKTEAKIAAAAAKFAAAISSGQRSEPKLSEVLTFRILKFNAMASREHFAADYAFFKDKEQYFIPVKIGALKSLAAKCIEKVFIKMMDKIA